MHGVSNTGKRKIVVAEVPESATAEQRAAFGRVLSRTASKVYLTQSRTSLAVGQRSMWEVVDGTDRPAEFELVPNRYTAIELALRNAKNGDQIMLVGMGSETWTPPTDKATWTDERAAKEAIQNFKVAPIAKVHSAKQSTTHLNVFNG
jgi:UDP-N-acetylmuramyl tripeptide synthase